MEEENQSAAAGLRRILKDDRSLLGNREELLRRLDADEALSFQALNLLQDALENSQISEFFAIADKGSADERKAAIASATAELQKNGTQVDLVQATIDAFVEALDWNKAPEPAPAPEPEAPAEEHEMPVWMKQMAAEAPKSSAESSKDAETSAEEAAPAPAGPWNCVCGQKANKGKFCVACGRPKGLGEAKADDTWTCQCGQKGNTGKFCTACGRSRVEGETGAAASVATNTTRTQPADNDATQVLPRVEEPPKPQFEPQLQRVELQPTPQPQQASQPSYQPPYQQPYANAGGAAPAHSGGSNKMLIAVIAILVVAIGAFVVKESSSDGTTTSSYSSLAKSSSSSSSSAAKPAREMKSDLSLGGLDLDMSIDDVRKALGSENTSEQRGKFNFLLYDNVEVGTYENSVRALVSDGPSAQTKRGIHEGSTYEDVKKAYGTDAMVTDYDDLTLYEYSFQSIGGSDGLLRFAVKKSDNTVKYISVRIPEDEKPAAAKVDTTAAQTALTDYYQNISHRNMRSAYDLLSSDMQNHMGSFENFSKGYQTTVSNKVGDIKVVSADGGTVVITYSLTSQDRLPNKRTKTQWFTGEAKLSNATGSWHIVDMTVKKQGEHIE